MGILEFLNQMTDNPLLFVAVTLTLGVILVNGWTDAPNAIATCVVTRCMPPRAAILMAAFFNFLGVFIMTKISNEVAVTITSMVDFGENEGRTIIIVLCAAMLAIVVWATLAWVFGIPTSESHALIAGLTGGAMALNGTGAIVWSQWVKVLYGIGISVALGFGLAWLICKLVTLICYKANRPKTEPFFKWAQIVGAAAMAFMHGAQVTKIYGYNSALRIYSAGNGSSSGLVYDSDVVDDRMLTCYGGRNGYGRQKDHKIGRYGYGKAREISGLFCRYSIIDLTCFLLGVRLTCFHHPR